jgi:hypothetical protein
MSFSRTVSDLWPMILASVLLIVWLVRLEGRVNQGDKDQEATEKRVDALTIKHENLDSNMMKSLMEVRESLARIEGALGVTRKS